MQRAKRHELSAAPRRMGAASGWLVGISVILGACSVSSPLALSSDGKGIARGTNVALMKVDAEQEMRAEFGQALKSAFASSGSPMSDNAPVFAEFSVSLNDASSGTVKGKGEAAEAGAQPDWLTTPRRNRNLDKCDAQRLRATLVLYARVDGEVLYRGTGEAIECDFSDDEIDAIAQRLVADAIGQAQP